jgi:hypothetical protein
MKRKEKVSHPSAIELDRLAAGELQGQALSELISHVEDCAQCQSYLQDIESERNQLLESSPPEGFVESLSSQELPETVGRQNILFFRLAGAVSAVAVVLMVVWAVLATHTNKKETRWMGQTVATRVVVNRHENRMLYTGQKLLPNDQLRFQIILDKGKTGYAVLLAVEKNEVSLILPKKPYRVTGEAWLPGGVTVEGSGITTTLLLVVRPELYKIKDLLKETQDRLNQLDSIPGLVKKITLDPVQQ